MLKRNIAMVLTAATLVLLLAGCEQLIGGGGGDGTSQAEIESQELTPAEIDAARTFWTPERLEAAEPYPIGTEGDPPPTSQPAITGEALDTVQSEGFADAAANLSSQQSLTPQTGHSAESSQVSSTNYPYSAMGKVFFTKDENWFSCSAAVIASENQSVVWTAGHCVAEQGNEDWHSNWIFIPGYDSGSEPYGRWAARTKATFVGWYSGGNRNYDLGAVVVERKDEQPIAYQTGSLGWMFNGPRDQDYEEYGYPSAGTNYGGQNLWTCSKPYDGADGVGSNPGPRTSTNDCVITAGASGGPWLVNSAENCPNCYINSVNSWWWWRGAQDVAVQWAGPYHGRAAHSLLQFAENL